MGPMPRSPHKKRRASKPPIQVEKDGSLSMWPHKGTVTRNHDGNDGHFRTIQGRRVKVQYRRKAHLRAQQPPGHPRGICLGAAVVKGKTSTPVERGCRCGGCSRRGM